MNQRLVAVAGGSGFIGAAIVRRLTAMPGIGVRVLTRSPERYRGELRWKGVDFIAADVIRPETLTAALSGADAVVDAVQFDGFPVESPARGLTFDRIDRQGVEALLGAARSAGVRKFLYLSGAAADQNSPHPAFRAKGMAERAIGESGIDYTILRPSLVFGPGDRTVSLLARALRYAPIFPVPGTGRQKVQPVFVDDVAACVALALTSTEAARNRLFDVGGPDLMTLDELIKLVMDVTGRRRPLVHIPGYLMRMAGAGAEKLPRPILSRDAVEFMMADNACDNRPIIAALGIRFVPAREALASYLK